MTNRLFFFLLLCSCGGIYEGPRRPSGKPCVGQTVGQIGGDPASVLVGRAPGRNWADGARNIQPVVHMGCIGHCSPLVNRLHMARQLEVQREQGIVAGVAGGIPVSTELSSVFHYR